MRSPEDDQRAHVELGAFYANVRRARGFTQAQLSRIAGISETRLRQIERARPPSNAREPSYASKETRLAIEAALGIPAGTGKRVLDGEPHGLDLDDLPPITVTDGAGRERIVYAGKVDEHRLTEAARQLGKKYLQTAS